MATTIYRDIVILAKYIGPANIFVFSKNSQKEPSYALVKGRKEDY